MKLENMGKRISSDVFHKSPKELLLDKKLFD